MTPSQELEVAYAERVEREVAMQTESGHVEFHYVSLLLWSFWWSMGVSENRLNPCQPNGFADHYPYEKWL